MKSSLRAHLWIFTPNSSKFRAIWNATPPKQHVVLKVLTDNKAFCFWNKALRPSTARNKRVKWVLTGLKSVGSSFEIVLWFIVLGYSNALC